MFTTTSPVQYILALATSPALTPLLDQFNPILEALMERIEESPAYTQLWESLPADARPELHRFAIQLNGLVNDAFLAGLLCAHVQQEG